jgi:hypothetical protein
VYFTGKKKAANPNPKEPDGVALQRVRGSMDRLNRIPPTQALFSPSAIRLWEGFYIDWEDKQGKERIGLYGAATKRIHVYIRKLAMTYAAVEGTLPEITLDQLRSAMGVGLYCAECARLLVDAQNAAIRPEGQIEQRFIDWIRRHPGARKRYMQQTLSKVAGSCEVFNRVLVALARADMIEIREGKVFPMVTG